MYALLAATRSHGAVAARHRGQHQQEGRKLHLQATRQGEPQEARRGAQETGGKACFF